MPFTINDLTFSSGHAELTRTSVAILRGWLQGLPAETLARFYLVDRDGEPMPAADALNQVHRLRDQLIPICHQYGLVEAAIGLRNGPKAAENHRRAALGALVEIEGKMAPGAAVLGPKPDQGVELWFSATLARRFQRAALPSFQAILGSFTEHGGGWWRKAPRIGEKTADVVLRWMMGQESLAAAPGMAELKEEYLPPALPLSSTPDQLVLGPSSPMVPYERIKALALDGTQGENRGPRNRLSAQNDLAAIQAWISLFPEESHTRRAYRKEAERFLLWAILERQKAFSSLTTEDAIAYRDFLANIPAHWIGPMTNRQSRLWRPFAGQLGAKSRAYAVTVLTNLCEWLMRRGYLDSNPWDGIPKIKVADRAMKLGRAIPAADWDVLVGWLNDRAAPPEAEQSRVERAAILLMRDTGLRRAEACSVTRGSLNYATGGADGWELSVVGKGNKIREIPVSDRAVEALKAHFADRRLDWNQAIDSTPLLSPVKIQSVAAQERHAGREAGYTPEGLHQLVRSVFQAFAKEHGGKIERVTAHALRHSFGVHAVAAGVDLDVIQGVMGHASLTTTTLYVQGDKVRRREQLTKKLYKQ